MTTHNTENARSDTADARQSVPTVEWAFMHLLVLGQIAPGLRDTTFNGKPIPYTPKPHIQSGFRWCSKHWSEADNGPRGFQAAVQGVYARIANHIYGGVYQGRMVVVADDRIERVVANAPGLVAADHDAVGGLLSWSMGFVRLGGRTRPAVRLSTAGTGDSKRETLEAVLDGVEVDWWVSIDPGYRGLVQNEPGGCSLWSGRFGDELVAQWDGPVCYESEPIPVRYLDLVVENGSPLLDRIIAIPEHVEIGGELLRRLTPDEEGEDRDVSGWITTRILRDDATRSPD